MLKEKESVTRRITTGTDNLARITNPRQHLCVQQLQIRTSIRVFSDYKSATANATDHMARITNPRQHLRRMIWGERAKGRKGWRNKKSKTFKRRVSQSFAQRTAEKEIIKKKFHLLFSQVPLRPCAVMPLSHYFLYGKYSNNHIFVTK
jgi:hypothetical protein